MENVQSFLKIIAGGLGSLGLLIITVQNFINVSQIIEEQFFIVLVMAWLLATVALWPKENINHKPIGPRPMEAPKTKLDLIKPYSWIIIVTFVFSILSFARFYELNRKIEGPIPYPNPQNEIHPLKNSLNSLEKNQFSINLISDIKENNVFAPKLLSFSLLEEKTSYEERQEGFGAVGNPIKTFALSYSLMEPIWNGRCSESFSLRAAQVLTALRNYAEKNNKNHLKKYIENEEQLANLVHNRPDIAKELIPQSTEWENLKNTEYNDILFWIKSCIGIPYPVFLVSIENPSENDIYLTEIRYNVKDLSQIKGGEPGPLSPKVRYIHELKYKKGIQKFNTNPPLTIPSKSASSFELQLWTNHPDLGLCWLMDVEFVTNKGIVKSEKFQLIMSGTPTWHKQRLK